MQSTVDWMDQVSAKFLTESNSSEEATTSGASLLGGRSAVITDVPYKAAIVAVGVGGMLMNFVVLLGFCVAGRSKMNVSSAYIANHTTLERLTFAFIAEMLISQLSQYPDQTFVLDFSPARPDLRNILRHSYVYLTIMPQLRSTYDGRLIYKTSCEERKAFLRNDSLAKS